MKNFDYNRFKMFGKYDLTINKAFYRNMSMTVLIGALGIVSLCFFTRWAMWNAFEEAMGDEPYVVANSFPFEHYSSQIITLLILVGFFSLMHTIFGGCCFHNLKNKQGRIMELTLPATNMEKFVWHVVLVFFGGALLIFASMLVADLANFLLGLCFFPDASQIPSLTMQAFHFAFSTTLDDEIMAVFPIERLNSMRTMVFAGLILSPSCYILGNAVKYRYNIILTYIAMFITENILSISLISTIVAFANNIEQTSMHDVNVTLNGFMLTGAVVELILAVGCICLAYYLYTRAQITSKLNK